MINRIATEPVMICEIGMHLVNVTLIILNLCFPTLIYSKSQLITSNTIIYFFGNFGNFLPTLWKEFKIESNSQQFCLQTQYWVQLGCGLLVYQTWPPMISGHSLQNHITFDFTNCSKTCDEGTPFGMSKLQFLWTKCTLTLKCTCDEGTPVM